MTAYGQGEHGQPEAHQPTEAKGGGRLPELGLEDAHGNASAHQEQDRQDGAAHHTQQHQAWQAGRHRPHSSLPAHGLLPRCALALGAPATAWL